MAESCPRCKTGLLELVEGDFGTGVFAPDGVQEMQHERFFACDRCSFRCDEDDLDLLSGPVVSND